MTAESEDDAIRVAIEPMALAHEGSEFDFVVDTWVRSGKDCPPYWWCDWGDYWEGMRPRILATLRSPGTVTLIARFADSPALYLGWVAYRPAERAIVYGYVKGAYRSARGVPCDDGKHTGSCAHLLLREAQQRMGVSDADTVIGTLPPSRDAIERARKRWRYRPWTM